MVFVSTHGRRGGTMGPSRPLSLLSAAALALTLFTTATSSFAADDKVKEESKDEKSEPEDSSEEAIEAPEDENSSESGEAAASTSLGSAFGGPAAASPFGPGDTIVFLETGLRSDLGLFLQRSTTGRAETEEEHDVKTGLRPMFHMGFLTRLFWQFRVGLGLGYGFSHTIEERLTQFQQDEEQTAEVWVLGQLFSADLRLEFSQPIIDKLHLIVTPRGGLQAIDTGEAIREENRRFRTTHNTRTGLQLGALGGIDVGARYNFTPWFGVRGTAGYAYYRQGLLRAKRKGDAADSDHVWRMTGARVGMNVGAEVSF